ncbi:MAG: large-conductance mechanosensitive channel protein MscL [Pseudomonadota bacterium]|nr:large-conductance mechanosensitive channel protein MscL [Pseudomonadota bacterium]
MSVVKEFREFAVKGNVVDMAVGIIIGGAFGKIVSSLVSDVVTPPLGYLIGGVDFTKLVATLPAITEGAEPVTIRYGVFLQATFDFIIVALAIFMLVKLINRLRRAEEAKPAPPAAPPRQEVLLEEIRDLLKQQR